MYKIVVLLNFKCYKITWMDTMVSDCALAHEIDNFKMIFVSESQMETFKK